MSSTAPTPTPTMDDIEAQRKEQYKQTVHYLALGTLIVSPVLIFLPPRTPVRTSVLLGFMGVGANHLAWEYSGEGLIARAQRRFTDFGQGQMPSERAREVQARLREERERKSKIGEASAVGRGVVGSGETSEEREAREKKSVLEKLWLGGEGEDWKAARDKKEKKALEEGKGYGDLIMEQIWEVWNWGGKKVEEVKEKDEEVVKARKEEQASKK